MSDLSLGSGSSQIEQPAVGSCVHVDSVYMHTPAHVSVEGFDDGMQLWGAANLLQELEKSTSADKV